MERSIVLFRLGLKVLALSDHLFVPRKGDFKRVFVRLLSARVHGLQYPPFWYFNHSHSHDEEAGKSASINQVVLLPISILFDFLGSGLSHIQLPSPKPGKSALGTRLSHLVCTNDLRRGLCRVFRVHI